MEITRQMKMFLKIRTFLYFFTQQEHLVISSTTTTIFVHTTYLQGIGTWCFCKTQKNHHKFSTGAAKLIGHIAQVVPQPVWTSENFQEAIYNYHTDK